MSEKFYTFQEYLNNSTDPSEYIKMYENYLSASDDLTIEQEKAIDEAVDKFLIKYKDKDLNSVDFEKFYEEMVNEGIIGSILGGITGFALGKSIGKVVARVMGVEKGFLYDLLTSRLVGAAMGVALGRKII